MNPSKIAVVIPCFNEEESLPNSLRKIWDCMEDLSNKGKISKDSLIFLIDDGSSDKTWEILSEAHRRAPEKVKAIKFTRNFGNQTAIFAGLKMIKIFDVDAAITIDADLQQDENKIEEFVEKFNEGYDIVAGVRENSEEYDFIKKQTSNLFYKLINWLGVNIKPNHSEFRLVSKKVLSLLDLYRENNLFLRGLFYELGLKLFNKRKKIRRIKIFFFKAFMLSKLRHCFIFNKTFKNNFLFRFNCCNYKLFNLGIYNFC